VADAFVNLCCLWVTEMEEAVQHAPTEKSGLHFPVPPKKSGPFSPWISSRKYGHPSVKKNQRLKAQ
jgi:hypothetical protein